ncbi:cytoglobin-1-like isoform X2 [Rhodnius prolixus]|uniref:cytoglobin-1-like isoform X2 n=1 Tax=Rhodnius prolixus TaxID=13249 RepID=UPI003D18942A
MPIIQDCGVSKEGIAAVRKTWEPVYKDKENSGVFLFQVLFELHPDFEKYFARFKSEGAKSLFDNPMFLFHVKHKVMDSLNEVIDNLENDERLLKILKSVASNHKKRNIKKEEFVTLGKVVLETLRRALGTAMNPEVEDAWTKVIDCAMSAIGKVTG